MQCRQCNITFKPDRKNSKYCSEACKTTWTNHNRKPIARKCKGCGVEFQSGQRHIQYCTRSCALTHTVVKRTLTCCDCNATFEFVGRTRKRRCAACHHKYWNAYYCAAATGAHSQVRDMYREHNPNWKPAAKYRRSLKGLPDEVRKYRSICFDYWPRCCSVCGSVDSADVHHIDGDRQNFDPSNLVPLCRSKHHNAVHVAARKRNPQPTKEDYTLATFEIWPEGPSATNAVGIIARERAKANIANSAKPLPVVGEVIPS